jgi:hypothetical protein
MDLARPLGLSLAIHGSVIKRTVPYRKLWQTVGVDAERSSSADLK